MINPRLIALTEVGLALGKAPKREEWCSCPYHAARRKLRRFTERSPDHAS